MGFFRRKDHVFTPTQAPTIATLNGVATSAEPAAQGQLLPCSFTVEDVFTITGRGTVVTGTVTAGTLRVGDVVTVVGAAGSREAQVLGIEMFRRKANSVSAGDTCGLALSSVKRDDIQRGDLVRTSL